MEDEHRKAAGYFFICASVLIFVSMYITRKAMKINKIITFI